MVQLQSFAETGAKCSKCGNSGLFKEKVFGGFLKLVYRYTMIKCRVCYNNKVIIDESLQ